VVATTHIIDWQAASANADKPPFVAVIEPSLPVVGDPLTISVYSAYPHTLTSPYNGLGAKTVNAKDKDIVEIIDLSGSTDVSTKFPIASVVSAVAAIALVDEANRQVVVFSSMPLNNLLSVVNQKLKINSALKLHGSIKLTYRTFSVQQWQHEPFSDSGSVILFAHNETLQNFETVAFSVSQKNETIKIEAYPTTGEFSYTPYAHFIVFPVNNNLIIKSDGGAVHKQGDVSHIITSEEVIFSGSNSINASFSIDTFKKCTGLFFDAVGNIIHPEFKAENGMLVSDVECYGSGSLDYATQGTVYSYDAEIKTTHLPSGAVDNQVTIGSVFVFDPSKSGIAASYKIPQYQQTITNPIIFCRVYSEYIIQETKRFELPPNFPTDNVFPNMPNADAVPEIDVTTLSVERTHTVGRYYSTGGSIDIEKEINRWYEPYHGMTEQPDVKYKMQESIPDSASEVDKQQMQRKINELKASYGIS
jgi:hypothetical protein